MQTTTVLDWGEGIASTSIPDAGAQSSTAERLPKPLTSFIGREAEIERLLALIRGQEARLITLTGPGGVGKTRLALRVAADIENAGERAVRFVNLAPITDGNLLLTTIGQSVGVAEAIGDSFAERLTAAIGDRDMLLVLDNFERLVDAGPVLSDLLNRCRALSILVTSRAVLRLSGERVWAVRPLDLPTPEATAAQAARSPAVRLFVDRADPQCRLSSDTAASSDLLAVGEICRRLDGLPLAIELAAAKTRLFSVQELVERLDAGIAFLHDGPRDAPPRLRSMHDMIAWSYDLLTKEEQAILRMLSVFTGGFTLRSAVALYQLHRESGTSSSGKPVDEVPAAELTELVHDLMLPLIDQSLVQQYTTNEGRYRFRMLETIREFGRTRLSEEGEYRTICDVHARWFASLVPPPHADTAPLARADRPHPFPDDHDNARTALAWSLDTGDLERAALLTLGLWPFWFEHGLFSEARQAQDRILECRQFDSMPLRAALMTDAARAAWMQSDFTRTRELATTALDLYQADGNQSGIAACLYCLGGAALPDDPTQAVSLYGESIAIQRSLGEKQSLATSLDALGGALMYCGDREAARAAYTESQALRSSTSNSRRCFNALGWVALAEGDLDLAEQLLREPLQPGPESLNPYPEAGTLRLLGRVELLRGNLASAADHYHRALAITTTIGALHESGYCVAELAAVAQAAGEPERAARWLGFEEAQRERQRLGLSPDESELRNRTRALALVAMGDAAFTAAWEEGRRVPAAKAFAEAREWHPRLPVTLDQHATLTRRELEVLEHLAGGQTNQEIAERLFLGKRTIDTHVSNILAKLGTSSRLGAVMAARDRGLIAR